MRTAAQLFLFFFMIDGGVSLIHELLSHYLQLDMLSALRALVSLIVSGLALLMFIALGFDRRLPKKLFLPLLGFLLWTATGCWPLVTAVSAEVLNLLAPLLQLGLGLAVAADLRARHVDSVAEPASAFDGKPFSFLSSLGYFTVMLTALPVVVALLLMATANHKLDEQTAGFMRLSPHGLYMKERSYRRQDQTVRLTGMIHIGDPGYYQALSQSLTGGKTVILAEGVADAEGLLSQEFSYSGVSSALGLVSQEGMQLQALKISIDELGTHAWSQQDQQSPHIARADVDLNTFDPLTIAFLNTLGSLLSGEKPLQQRLADYYAWIAQNSGPDMIDVILGDIIERRNRALIANLDAALPYYDTIVIPWGALHMPAFEQALRERGFVPSDERERMSIDFSDLPIESLARQLMKNNPQQQQSAK